MSGARYDWSGVPALIAAGASQADVARAVGCAPTAVRAWADRKGVVLKPKVKTTTEDRYGCSNAEARRLNGGVPLNRAGHPASYFRDSWRAAEKRGIGFEMTFPEWMEVWGDRLSLRGRHSGDLCMARIGDRGPYKVGNVEIITARVNVQDSFKNVQRRAPVCTKPRHKPTPRPPGYGRGYVVHPKQTLRPFNAYARGKYLGSFASKDEAIAAYRAACGAT